MSKYGDEHLSNWDDDGVRRHSVSRDEPPITTFSEENKRAYLFRERQQWTADSTPTWPLDANRTSPGSPRPPRSRFSNPGPSPTGVGRTSGRRPAIWHWLTRRASRRKSALAGVLTIIAVLSGLLIAIGPVHQQADAAPLAIYDGSLASGWQITTSHSTVGSASIASPDGAGHPLAWTAAAQRSALLIRAKSPTSLASYSTLTISVQSAQVGERFSIASLTKGGRIIAPVTPLGAVGGRPKPHSWTQYTIPLAKLAPHTGTLNGIGLFAWFGRLGDAKPVTYVDRIKLLALPISDPAQPTTAATAPARASAPAATSVPASPTQGSGQTPSRLPPTPSGGTFEGQGVYESCAPDKGATCLDHLNQIAAGGFRLVVNYDQMYGTASQQLAYLDRAKAVGVKVIFGMSDPAFWDGTDLRSQYSELGATCGCSDNAGFIRYVVDLVKGQPALWGYYVGDEVSSGNAATVQAFSSLVHQADPFHPRLYVADGTTGHMNADLSPFASSAEVLGADIYPVGENPADSIYNSIAGVGTATQGDQAIASQYGRGSAMVLQAFSWGQYPGGWGCSQYPSTCTAFPTEAQMEQMRNLALQNGHLQMILWYSYYNILRSDNPTQHWHDLVTAANAPFPSNSLTH